MSSWGNYERNSEYSGSGTCPDCGWNGERLHQHNCKNPGFHRRQLARKAEIARIEKEKREKQAKLVEQNRNELNKAIQNSFKTAEEERKILVQELAIERGLNAVLMKELADLQEICQQLMPQEPEEEVNYEEDADQLELYDQEEFAEPRQSSCSSAKRARIDP